MRLAPTNDPRATQAAPTPTPSRAGRRPEQLSPDQLVAKVENRREKMREKGKEYRKLSKAKRFAGTLRREAKIVGKLDVAVSKWLPVEGVDLDAVRKAIKTALARIVEAADKLEELPDGVGKGLRGGPRDKTLAVGDTVRVRDKMSEQYAGTLEPGRAYKVVEFRAAMVRLDIVGAAVFVPRGHLVRA